MSSIEPYYLAINVPQTALVAGNSVAFAQLASSKEGVKEAVWFTHVAPAQLDGT